MTDQELDRMLQEFMHQGEQDIPDNGFSQKVVQAISREAVPEWLRKSIILASAIIGIVLFKIFSSGVLESFAATYQTAESKLSGFFMGLMSSHTVMQALHFSATVLGPIKTMPSYYYILTIGILAGLIAMTLLDSESI